jgi:hypothetical protein
MVGWGDHWSDGKGLWGACLVWVGAASLSKHWRVDTQDWVLVWGLIWKNFFWPSRKEGPSLTSSSRIAILFWYMGQFLLCSRAAHTMHWTGTESFTRPYSPQFHRLTSKYAFVGRVRTSSSRTRGTPKARNTVHRGNGLLSLFPSTYML